MRKSERPEDHEKFKELCALAQANALSFAEQRDLRNHLESCEFCREIRNEYDLIGQDGMRFLSGNYDAEKDAEHWNSSGLRLRLFEALREETTASPETASNSHAGSERRALRNSIARPVYAALAACLLIAIAFGAYRAGEQKGEAAHRVPLAAAAPKVLVAPTIHGPADLPPSLADQVSRLEVLLSTQRREVDRLDSALKLSEQRVVETSISEDKKDASLRQLVDDRDKLATELTASQDANKAMQDSLASLRTEHDEAIAKAESLREKVTDLTLAANDQGRRLKDDEQYLSSDRDIRELMGARKLYIADVFDVDSVSRTRKPFGRVFYTQNKSLVFYAFDLDHEPGIKNASTFQVWGQKDAEPNSGSHPMNLGILYEDSESNRRWVLRTDDSKQLSEIDAVFVTVEPHGGSQKPTGKPFLYALLRKEANHP